MTIEIKISGITEPSTKKLSLVKITSMSKKWYSKKTGGLKKYTRQYGQAYEYLGNYWLIDYNSENPENNFNCEVLKTFKISNDDIQFQFLFSPELHAKTLSELLEKIKEHLSSCEKQILLCQKKAENIENLLSDVEHFVKKESGGRA